MVPELFSDHWGLKDGETLSKASWTYITVGDEGILDVLSSASKCLWLACGSYYMGFCGCLGSLLYFKINICLYLYIYIKIDKLKDSFLYLHLCCSLGARLSEENRLSYLVCFNAGERSLTTAERLEPCFLPKVDLAVWWLSLLPDPHSAVNQTRKWFSILFPVSCSCW